MWRKYVEKNSRSLNTVIKILISFISLKGGERKEERQALHSSICFPNGCNSKVWARAQPEARSFTTHSLPNHVNKQPGRKLNSQDWNGHCHTRCPNYKQLFNSLFHNMRTRCSHKMRFSIEDKVNIFPKKKYVPISPNLNFA